MLRYTRTLEICLSNKERLFSANLIKGFVFAALFHLALFLIFRIAQLPNLDRIHPIFPVNVEVDLGAPETSALLPETHLTAYRPLFPSPIQACKDPLFAESKSLLIEQRIEPHLSTELFYLPLEEFPEEKE